MNKTKINKINTAMHEILNNIKFRLLICSPVYLLMFLLFIFFIPAFAYEDALIMTNGKMTDIKIQHNDIIDVFPLITITNDKNTLIVHPLKVGKTKFSILKNNKDKYIFDVEVTKDATNVIAPKDFETMTVDCPPSEYGDDFEIDKPPVYYDDKIDEPPILRGN